MSDLDGGTGPDPDERVEEPIEISDERYERIVVAALEAIPSLASWIWEHRDDVVGDDFGRILALLERLPPGDREEVLRVIRDERIAALHDLLVRIDIELYAALEQHPERYFGTLHHDFVGRVDDADSAAGSEHGSAAQ